MARFIVLAITLMLATGCARLNSIHRNSGTKSVKTIAIDAKQRFMISKNRTGQTWKDVLIDDDPVTYQRVAVTTTTPVFCTEPSPDVFSVFSAALAGSGSAKTEALSAAFEATTGETAGTIGIRTQSIQLLRDAMYRICESYVNGGITDQDYNKLLQRYQKSMVTLIAVEQLTGAAQPAQLVLQAGATLEVSDSVRDIEAALAEAKKEEATAAKAVADNQTEIETQTAALDDKPDETCVDGVPSEEKYKEACEAYTKAKGQTAGLKATLAEKKDRVATWQKKFDEASAKTSLATTGANTVIPADVTKPGENAMPFVAYEVGQMVTQVFMDDVISTCFDSLDRFEHSLNNLNKYTGNTKDVTKWTINIFQHIAETCTNMLNAAARTFDPGSPYPQPMRKPEEKLQFSR